MAKMPGTSTVKKKPNSNSYTSKTMKEFKRDIARTIGAGKGKKKGK